MTTAYAWCYRSLRFGNKDASAKAKMHKQDIWWKWSVLYSHRQRIGGTDLTTIMGHVIEEALNTIIMYSKNEQDDDPTVLDRTTSCSSFHFNSPLSTY